MKIEIEFNRVGTDYKQINDVDILRRIINMLDPEILKEQNNIAGDIAGIDGKIYGHYKFQK